MITCPNNIYFTFGSKYVLAFSQSSKEFSPDSRIYVRLATFSIYGRTHITLPVDVSEMAKTTPKRSGGFPQQNGDMLII